MSLPANVKLSVQGHSRPGDTLHSVPKKAMVVRMTAETLDALQATPHMEFSFGSEPGIHIGDAFFPMRALKENSPHDLYLRASSAAKPMAPLKLYANITGKFTVERDLSKIQDKIRSTTLGAEKIRKERGITMLDASELPSTQTGKKRKAPAANSSMFRKPVAQPRPSTSTPVSTAAAAAALSPLSPTIRTAVIKALAVKDRSIEELLRLIPSEGDADKLKRRLVELLSQLAEQRNPKAPSHWRLKPATWVEVRPYEWSDLTEQEKTAMARTARLTFNNLNIPESDPVWAHVVYRKGADSAMVASGSGSSKASAANRAAAKGDAPKRGVSSKEAKEKKAKPKADPKAEILMKDESRPASRPSTSKVDDGTSISAAKAAASRKVPGSGFKSSKVPSPDSHHPSPPPATNSVSRSGPVDVRMKDRERPRASLPAKPVPPILPPTQDKKPGALRIKKVPKDALPSDRERERDVEGTGKEPLKRKKPSQDVDESDVPSSAPKRRRTDGVVPARDLSLPKKPDTSLVPVSRSLPTKKEPSPLPPARKSKSEASSLPPPPRSSLPSRPTGSTSSSNPAESRSSSKHSTQTQRTNSSISKRRDRRSPIYTSSEDEGEIRVSVRREQAPLPTPPATTVHPSKGSRGQQSSGVSRPLPTDRDGLRARYTATYLKYLHTYQQLYAQQTKLESLLNGRDGSTISDSDGDVEVLSTEDTMKLKTEHKRWERELENIRGVFSTAERNEFKSD
ncbi:hypothetical protein B0H15DRAFT_888331 [Mycena belliarum]|uniref:RNA polymerase II elongation factor ELL N-terminal domain-containing protein n=1 Tax=Mycena belliarum TaxID=1033014 RepID=A0AAD6XK51_9AGAR|nr:hypothetical protein B0H15DRAFT_888331 [Mycena belliae]